MWRPKGSLGLKDSSIGAGWLAGWHRETIIRKQETPNNMETFDGKKAAQDYMSKHTLAFSTPELTLMRFAFWLGDSVPDPNNAG